MRWQGMPTAEQLGGDEHDDRDDRCDRYDRYGGKREPPGYGDRARPFCGDPIENARSEIRTRLANRHLPRNGIYSRVEQIDSVIPHRCIHVPANVASPGGALPRCAT